MLQSAAALSVEHHVLQAAIVAFTKGLANMLMSTNGIRVNCVNPGPIWTVCNFHACGITLLPAVYSPCAAYQTSLIMSGFTLWCSPSSRCPSQKEL